MYRNQDDNLVSFSREVTSLSQHIKLRKILSPSGRVIQSSDFRFIKINS